jgi:hypothetical protein
MRLCLTIKLLFLLASSVLCAQQTYTVKAGERIAEVLSFNQIFLYPTFLDGTVFFRDGKNASGKFNYNMLVAEIQFIDPKGDTLSLANEKMLKQIVVARDTFYYNPVCVRGLINDGVVKLGERAYFKEFVQKPGAYGISTATTATNSVDVLVEPRRVSLNAEQEVTLVKHTQYLFAGKYSAYLPAGKKNLLKSFPKYKTQISNYLDSSPVDFSRREDMEKLLHFLSGVIQ